MQYLMVESEFGALSAAIGAPPRARDVHRDREPGPALHGQALYNASGWPPIVMTVVNTRSERRSTSGTTTRLDVQRDSGDPAVRGVQPGGRRHSLQAFPSPRALGSGGGVHGRFVLTHAFEHVDLPTQDQVDAFLPVFEPQQRLDPDDPVTIGGMVGPEAFTEGKYLMHAKQCGRSTSCRRSPASSAHAFGRDSGGWSLYPRRRPHGRRRLGSVLGTITRSWTSCVEGVESLAGHPRASPRGPGERDLHARSATAWSSSESVRRSASEGSSGRTSVTPPGASRPRCTTSWPAWGGRPITSGRYVGLLTTSSGAASSPADRLTDSSTSTMTCSAELERIAGAAGRGHTPRTSCSIGTVGSRPPLGEAYGRLGDQPTTRHLLAEPAARPRGAHRPSPHRAVEHPDLGSPRACRGCGGGARRALRPRRHHASHRGQSGRRQRTGCLEVLSTPYPESSWQLP